MSEQNTGRVDDYIKKLLNSFISQLMHGLIDKINHTRESLTMYSHPKRENTELDKIIKDRLEERVRNQLSDIKTVYSYVKFMEYKDDSTEQLLKEMKDFQPKHYQHSLGEDNAYLKAEIKELRLLIFYLMITNNPELKHDKALEGIDIATANVHYIKQLIYHGTDPYSMNYSCKNKFKQIKDERQLEFPFMCSTAE